MGVSIDHSIEVLEILEDHIDASSKVVLHAIICERCYTYDLGPGSCPIGLELWKNAEKAEEIAKPYLIQAAIEVGYMPTNQA